MKLFQICSILLLSTFLFSCKNNTTGTEITTHDYIGWVFIEDSTGEVNGNRNNDIKVTLVETGATTTTDSVGHYAFTHLQSGTYNFKYEYKDYPIFYFQDVNLSGQNGSTIQSEGSSISPKSIWNFTLDSTNYGIWYSTSKPTVDTGINIYFRRTSSKLTRFSNYLCVMSKSANNLDYFNGQYMLIDGWSSSSIAPSLTASVSHYVLYDSLRTKGFQQGDSVYIKLYSLNSISFYIDKTTNKRVYPSIGVQSNVISTIVK